jgi:L-aspartate oxidase
MNPDFLVIGAGVAGLRAAIELAQAGTVLVVAKDTLHESSSEYAQGGIAAALSDDDEVGLHEQDTIIAGDGLCDVAAVRTLVEEAPNAIQELIEWGAAFDRDGARLLFAREGAHSRSRVLHAHGDSTGREIVDTLYRRAAADERISFRSFAAMTDLLVGGDGSVCGASVLDAASGECVSIQARALLLATGGLGRVYKETTNPDVATADGVAAAWRAGADIADIEFVQFHPTALFVEGAPRFLLSEALRGEGALLRNAAGERFMPRYHALAELAPRDVVSRAIVSEMQRTGAPVFLDLTHLEAAHIRSRFPRIYETCLSCGVDITTQRVPVHPAAHYSMGGVRTNLDGRTSRPGLYAAGEVACTGVHGANRLASNSLLEGLVFGARTGRAIRDEAGPRRCDGNAAGAVIPAIDERAVRALAWEDLGIVRSRQSISAALEKLSAANERAVSAEGAGRAEYELRNMAAVADLIGRCALERRESRGGHYRSDFPEKSPEFQRHSVISKNGGYRLE